MNNIDVRKTFIPQTDGRALDFIKACAAVFMVIDHVNMTLLDSAHPPMFLIGRATFPLFCYALAVSLMKVGPEKAPHYAWTRYAPRLLLLAVITEPIAQFSRDIGPIGNVLFTLTLGAVMAGLCFRLKQWQTATLCLLAIGLMYFPQVFEFSTAGVMLPAAFILAMRGRIIGFACLGALLCFINLPGFADVLEKSDPDVLVFICMVAAACIIVPISLIRFAATQPQDGRYLPKYFLHVFYPLHLLVIWAIGYFFMGIGA
jgi:hypothetical protein